MFLFSKIEPYFLKIDCTSADTCEPAFSCLCWLFKQTCLVGFTKVCFCLSGLGYKLIGQAQRNQWAITAAAGTLSL